MQNNFVTYPMEFSLCKMKFVGKGKTSFNIHLNDHRSDVSDPHAITACCHFTQPGHDFDIHAKFTLIKTTMDKMILTTFDNSQLHGINHELNA